MPKHDPLQPIGYVPYQKRSATSTRIVEPTPRRAAPPSPLGPHAPSRAHRHASESGAGPRSSQLVRIVSAPAPPPLRVVSKSSQSASLKGKEPVRSSAGDAPSPPPLRRVHANAQEITPPRIATPESKDQSPLLGAWDSPTSELARLSPLKRVQDTEGTSSDASLSRSITPMHSTLHTPSPSRDIPAIHHHSYAATLALHDNTELDAPTKPAPSAAKKVPVARQRPYRPGFQPKGVIRHRTDEFEQLRAKQRGTVELEEQRMERRLTKLIAIHSPDFAHELSAPSPSASSNLLARGAHVLDLFQSREEAEKSRRTQRQRAAEQRVVKWQEDTDAQNCATCG